MLDVTELVTRYRLALRALWNSYIFVDPTRREWDDVESWERLKLPLYNCLVADALSIEDGTQIFGEHFHVRPLPGQKFYTSIQINITDPPGQTSGVWDRYKPQLSDENADLILIDLYDWRPLAYRNLQYYMVRINAFAPMESMVGRLALVEATDTIVLWDPRPDGSSGAGSQG